MILHQKAKEVIDILKQNKEFEKEMFDDFLTIAIVIGIILTVIQLFFKCRWSAKRAILKISEASVLEKALLKRIVRKEVEKLEKLEKYREDLQLGLMIMGRRLTESELEILYEEAKKSR